MDVPTTWVWLSRLATCAAALVALCATAQAAPPPAAVPRPFRASIEAAVGTEAGLLAVTRAGVVVIDPSGKAIGALPAGAGSSRGAFGERGAGTRFGPRAPAPPWPGLTADTDYSGGLYDPDDIDDGDDPRLADHSVSRPWEIDEEERRRRDTGHALGSSRLPWIAAEGVTGWVIRDDGIWRIDLRTGAASRVHPPPRAHVRGAAAGVGGGDSILVVVEGDDLLVFPAAAGSRQRVTGAAAGVRNIVVGPAGTILGWDWGGRLRTLPFASTGAPVARTLFTGGVDDVVGCDGTALVLADESIFRVSVPPGGAGAAAAPPALSVGRVGRAPPGTERLACGAAEAGWVAFGAALHVSADAGRTWHERPGPSTRPLGALIPTRGALWVAVPAGLWPLAPANAAPSPAPRAREMLPRSPPDRGTAIDRLRTPLSFWWRWAGWLPVVDLEFEVGRVGPVRDVRGLVCASFRLDGPLTSPPPRPGRMRTGSADGGPGAAELEALTTLGADLTTVEEHRALARILEEPP